MFFVWLIIILVDDKITKYCFYYHISNFLEFFFHKKKQPRILRVAVTSQVQDEIDLSLDARQETRIVVLTKNQERTDERISDLTERIKEAERKITVVFALGSAALAILTLLAQISKAYL